MPEDGLVQPEPITPTAPRTVRTAVFTQAWTRLTSLHWPYPPEAVRPLLPPGIEPDVFDRRTWVGLIPFAMREVAVLGVRPPYVSNFLETNVRLYGVDGRGRRGVVFRSLDASRLVPVLAARASYRLPYEWSSMRLHARGNEVTYTCRRLWPDAVGSRSRIRVRIGDPVAQLSELDHFHSARWALHMRWGASAAYAEVTHASWRLHAAEVLELDDQLVTAAGLPPPVGPPLVRYFPGVRVRIGPPQLP